MPRTVARIMWENDAAVAGAAFLASSNQGTFPVSYFRDQAPTKVWRSKVGWNIDAGFNDKIDVREGGVLRVATLDPGPYATGTLLAAQVQAALNDMSGATNTYLCVYDVTGKKFEISRDTGSDSVDLLWLTGANATASVGLDLGFYVTADSAGLTSYVAQLQAYHSREWVRFDLGEALPARAGVVWGHNSGEGGSYLLKGNTSDSWAAPAFAQTLADGGTRRRVAFFDYQTLRYWRLEIADVQNPLGYSEVGVVFVGDYTEPSVTYSVDHVKDYEELSDVVVSDAGSHFFTERAQRLVWSLRWAHVELSDRELLEDFLVAVKRGRDFFFAFNAEADPADTEYVFRPGGSSVELVGGAYWDVSFSVAQSL